MSLIFSWFSQSSSFLSWPSCPWLSCCTQLVLSEQHGVCHQCHHVPGAGTALWDTLMSPKAAVTSLSSPASDTNRVNLSCHIWKNLNFGVIATNPRSGFNTDPPPATLRHHLLKPPHGKLAGKRHFPKPKSPLNLYFLTWKINLTTVRCSASKRNHWILAKCKILGMPCAFPVCQHMEWAINGPFHHLDSSAAQNIPPPLSWHWYNIPSFQKKSQLDGEREKLDFQHGYYH